MEKQDRLVTMHIIVAAESVSPPAPGYHSLFLQAYIRIHQFSKLLCLAGLGFYVQGLFTIRQGFSVVTQMKVNLGPRP
jgi:hypothetical protein